MRKYNDAHPRISPSERIIGIDGEGQGRRPHCYYYLAAADEHGSKWSVAAQVSGGRRKLSTTECLDFILSLPGRALIFGYAFFYDLTKILQDLPAREIYLLFHEKRRLAVVKGKVIYRPVKWNGYKLNYMNRRFTVEKGGRRATVWDIFAFFQSKFTKALTDWQVAEKAKLERMEAMKSKRADFDKMKPEEVYAYCDEECGYLATLGRKLIDTHVEAGLRLRSYFGAGSTASALLKALDVNSFRGDWPDEMRHAVACAFFGGRFENSVCGEIPGPVYSYDISSAYPYQACLLPCLLCGKWCRKESPDRRELAESSLSLVRWVITEITAGPWGSLPVRAANGTIAFPLSGKGGWCWKQEFLAAQKFNKNVRATEAWIYETKCGHRPFSQLADIYRERCRIGKDAKGIVLKLGPNSVYGKLAQSKGAVCPFQEWVWAGNITSGTRAQLLEALLIANDPRSILMFATDGVQSREKLDLPKPVDTGTFDLPKPLGGWEEKIYDRGVFYVRPGIYFPMDPKCRCDAPDKNGHEKDCEIEKVRARGLGRKVVYEQWRSIVAAFNEGRNHIDIGGVSRFVGAKTGVTYGPKSGFKKSPDYGEWVDHPIRLTFSPFPKRRAILKDGTLDPWPEAEESLPYKNAIKSPEAELLELAELIAEEQPDADFAELQ